MAALLKVNGENIDVPAAIRLSILHSATFLRETIRLVIIRQCAQKRDIRNSDGELQLAADELGYTAASSRSKRPSSGCARTIRRRSPSRREST